MELFVLIFIALAVIVAIYVFSLLKDAIILFILTTSILFAASKLYPQYVSFNSYNLLLSNIVIVGGYVIIEILNLIFNVVDVVSSIFSFLLSPFKRKKRGEEK